MNRRLLPQFVVTLALCVGSAMAAPLTVDNFSFEMPGNGPNGFGGTITSWVDGDGAGTQAGTFNPTATRYPLSGGATDGGNVAFSNGPTISQTLSATYQPNTIYTLEVDVGDRNDTTFPGFDVQLYSGGVLVGSASETHLSVPNGGFATATVSFAASSGFVGNGSPIQILLNSDGGQTNFDNVRVDASAAAAGLGDVLSISVLNPSFEQPLHAPNANSNGVPGWTVAGPSNAGTFFPTASRYPLTGGPTDGNNVAFSNGQTISQVLGDVVEALNAYTLQVDVGDRSDTTFPGFDVELYAGGNLLGSVDETTLTVPDGGFATATIEYFATGDDINLGQNFEIRLTSDGGQTNFDNVRFTAVQTPEPASYCLWVTLGTAFGLLTWRRRRSIQSSITT